MRELKFVRIVLLVGVLMAGGVQLSSIHAQEATKPATKEVEKKAAGNRLPAYYKDVVTESQRQSIYKIQAAYKEKIAALAEQIKKLQAEQLAEIDALLNEEQKTKLAAIKEAAAKAKATTAAAIKAADEARAAKKEAVKKEAAAD